MLKKDSSNEKDNSLTSKSIKEKKESGQKNSKSSEKKKSDKAKSKNKAGTAKTKSSKETEALKKELARAHDEINRLKDQALRSIAELDNFRKRKEKETAQRILNANETLILSILPVVDDFERSLKMSDESDINQFHQGMELIYQKLMGVLSKAGVKPMESIGQPFDVALHEAMMQKEVQDLPGGQVVDEHVKGYYMNDKILRHAKVIISK